MKNYKKQVDKFAENFDEYSVRGIRHSNLGKVFSKYGANYEEFEEWFAGKTGFFSPDEEKCYFIDDVVLFLKNNEAEQ